MGAKAGSGGLGIEDGRGVFAATGFELAAGAAGAGGVARGGRSRCLAVAAVQREGALLCSWG